MDNEHSAVQGESSTNFPHRVSARWPFDQASGPRRRTYTSGLFVVGLCLTAMHSAVNAQETRENSKAERLGAMDAWANWALAPKVWKGQTVPAPEPVPRAPDAPTAARALDSLDLPVRVHVPARSAASWAQASLQALEHAYSTLHAAGWPLPAFDGGYGGNGSLDLYAVSETHCADACSAIDGPLLWSDFDAAQSYALIAQDLPEQTLAGCALSALAQAGLRGVDPAEAATWVRASAELAVWQLLGELGCDGSLARAQAQPELGVLGVDPRTAGAGALLLAMLSERLDDRAGVWLHGLWESTRQRSAGLVSSERLRSSPDLWEVLRQTLGLRQIALDDELLAFSVARYFAGPPERRARASHAIFAALPNSAGVPITRELHSTHLPERILDSPLLHDVGSAYLRIQIDDGARPSQLQAWLHGEYGVRWSLIAVRLDADGHEVGRTAAPPRNVPNSYLPIALDDETRSVLLVITQLPEHLPDADSRIDTGHGYELILAGETR